MRRELGHADGQGHIPFDGAEREITDLRGAETPAPRLPPLADVLAELGGWASALEGADGPARRETLIALINHVVPERIGYGRYEARITWTPTGAALHQAAAAGAANLQGTIPNEIAPRR